MSNIPQSASPTRKQPQDIFNQSVDQDFEILAVEIVGHDGTNLQRIKVDSSGRLVSSEEQATDVIATQASIGLAAVQLGDNACPNGVVVKALNTNTGSLYVGKTGVTTSTGFELGAGESVTLPVDNSNRVYVISDTAAQTVSYIVV